MDSGPPKLEGPEDADSTSLASGQESYLLYNNVMHYASCPSVRLSVRLSRTNS